MGGVQGVNSSGSARVHFPTLLWMNLEDSSEQGGIVTRLNTDSPLDFEVFFERYKPISNLFNPEGLGMAQFCGRS